MDKFNVNDRNARAFYLLLELSKYDDNYDILGS